MLSLLQTTPEPHLPFVRPATGATTLSAHTGVKAFNQTPIGYRISRPTARAGSPAGAPPSRNPQGHYAAPATRAEVRIAAPAPAGRLIRRLAGSPPGPKCPVRPHLERTTSLRETPIAGQSPSSPPASAPPRIPLPNRVVHGNSSVPRQRRRRPKPVFVTRPVLDAPPSIPRTREPYDESGPPTRGTCTQEREATNI